MSYRGTYNERLFRGGIRKWVHLSRFNWLSQMCVRHRPDMSCVVELGCFDGRVLGYIPKPVKYYGFDANWEGGLAEASLSNVDPSIRFVECRLPENFANVEEKVTCCISLETLEHIPVDLIDGYIKKMSSILNGYLFVTVPNEKGILFACKYLAKLIFGGVRNTHSGNSSVPFWEKCSM